MKQLERQPDEQPEPMVRTLSLDQIHEAPSNPNAMDPAEFALLVEAVRRVGFLQPILVRPLGEDVDDEAGVEIVDGHHRARAAREVGLTSIPCVVKHDADGNDATALAIGMNRLRGELDLVQVGHALDDLIESGWSHDDLLITGFNEDEITTLLDAVRDDDPDDLAREALGAGEPPAADEDTSTHTLSIRFTDRAAFEAARAALKTRGDGDMTAGLCDVLGIESDGNA